MWMGLLLHWTKYYVPKVYQRTTIVIVAVITMLAASCRTGTVSTGHPAVELDHPVVLVLYPETIDVARDVQASVDAARDSLQAANAARRFDSSEAFTVDPDRAAVLRYARFADEDVVANALDHRLGSRTWNSVFTVLSFTLGDAMVHLDTTMALRGSAAVRYAQALGAQYILVSPSMRLEALNGTRTCRATVNLLHVPSGRVMLDTVVTATDSGLITRTHYVRGGTWVSAIDAVAAKVGELPSAFIKRTLPRYVRRDSVMHERQTWFARNLWPTRVDAELDSVLRADTLQPPDAVHRWMLRSPDGSKAMVSSVATFGGTIGLRFMRNAQGVVIYPPNQLDTARLAFTLYAAERVDGTWYFDRVRTTFKNQPVYSDAEHMQFTFDALKSLWYTENEGMPGGEFWERDSFRRMDGVPLLQHLHHLYD